MTDPFDEEKTRKLRVLSLGGGVQSTAMLLMALDGAFGDRPDVAIFADTGWEPAGVYEHLRRLTAHAAERGLPVVTVSAGDLRADALEAATDTGPVPRTRFAAMPLYATNPDGSGTMLRRQCTREYKLAPIRREVRKLMAERGVKRAEMWIGISSDEIVRMRESGLRYLAHRYPLIDARMSRGDCMLWLERHGHPVPAKSACIGCPFHSNPVWREMKRSDPESFRDAVAFDDAIRHMPKVRGDVYLHPTLRPLSEVEFGESQLTFEDGFLNECEGMCGV